MGLLRAEASQQLHINNLYFIRTHSSSIDLCHVDNIPITWFQIGFDKLGLKRNGYWLICMYLLSYFCILSKMKGIVIGCKSTQTCWK